MTQLTAAEAQAQGLVPTGHEWDEALQEPVARGTAMMIAHLDKAVDLQANLASFKANRDTLVRFVREYLEEADYDSRRLPIPGKMRDYYLVPGAQTKALTKLGAEKLGHLFRLGRARTTVVATTETKEYVSATAECVLTDQYRREIGSAVSSCTTAEKAFASDFAKKKYGGDYRAALNDVVARATKRAYVQAMIVATAADEVFTSAEEVSADKTGTSGDTMPAPAAEAEQDPALTRETPCPFAGDKALKDLSPNQLRWLEELGHVGGEQAEEWLALVAKELDTRKAPAGKKK
jgi:hypothetical protein